MDAVFVFFIKNNEIINVNNEISYAIAVNEPTAGATPFPPLNFINMGQQCPSIIAIAVNEITIGIDSLFKYRILFDNFKYMINEKALKKSKRNTSIPILRPNTLVTFVAPVEPLPMLCKSAFAKNFVII